MQHDRQRHQINRDQHHRQHRHQFAVRLDVDRLDERGRRYEAGRYSDDEIQNAKHVPGPHETSGIVRRSGIGEADDRSEQADSDVANACRPGEEARQLPRNVENEEDHAERAVKLYADQPLLRHGIEETRHRVRSPKQQAADQNGQGDAVLDGGDSACAHVVDTHRRQSDRQGEPADEDCGRDAQRPRPVRRRPSRVGQGAIEPVEDGGDRRQGAGEDEIGEIGWNGHDTPP